MSKSFLVRKIENDTKEQFNKLIEFRQSVYEKVFLTERNGQQELVDALLSGQRVRSFAELTLSTFHQRGWGSSYQALERGRQSSERLQKLYAAQLPSESVNIFAIDGTKWPHREAKTLSDLTLERHDHRIQPAHLYSKLCWIPARGSSWALPLSTVRAKSEETEGEVGIQQVSDIQPYLPEKGTSIYVVDGRYGNAPFLRGMAELKATVVARLAKNRVFYAPAPRYSGMGRPAVRGDRFDFKDETSWWTPTETVVFEHAQYNQVRLRRWDNLYDKQVTDVPITLVLAEIHQEQANPPEPLWLMYYGSPATAQTIWEWYGWRFPIEPAIRFTKQRLYWTLPRFQTTQRCDRWTRLVDVAYWNVWLSRHLVDDCPLPWQKPQKKPKPERILEGSCRLLVTLPTLTSKVKPRGKSPGWTPGRPRSPVPRFSLAIRAKKKA